MNESRVMNPVKLASLGTTNNFDNNILNLNFYQELYFFFDSSRLILKLDSTSSLIKHPDSDLIHSWWQYKTNIRKL